MPTVMAIQIMKTPLRRMRILTRIIPTRILILPMEIRIPIMKFILIILIGILGIIILITAIVMRIGIMAIGIIFLMKILMQTIIIIQTRPIQTAIRILMLIGPIIVIFIQMTIQTVTTIKRIAIIQIIIIQRISMSRILSDNINKLKIIQ